MTDAMLAVRTSSEDPRVLSETTEIGVQPARLVKDHFDRPVAASVSSSSITEQSKQSEQPTLRMKTVNTDVLPENFLVRPRDREPYIASFSILQEWEGYVIAIAQDHFTARLVDITDGGHTARTEGEEVDLPLSDLTEDERRALKLGSVFRWVVGYEITRMRQRKRASQIVFRQLPKWTNTELAEAKKEGRARADRIKWE